MTVFTLFGLALSVKVMLTLSAVEVGVFVALMISGLVSPGSGGFNFKSFNPGNIPSGNGLYLGIVFTILALSGFESVAPLGEETENPKRNLPLAIVGSTILVAVFYMFVNWGVLVGEGTDNVKNFTASEPDLRPRPPALGRSLDRHPHRRGQLRARGLHRDSERDDTRALRHGAGEGAAAPPREGAPALEDAVERDLVPDRRHTGDRGRARLVARPGEDVRDDRDHADARPDHRLLHGQHRGDALLRPRAEVRVQHLAARRDPGADHDRAGVGLLEERRDAASLQSKERVRLQPAARDHLGGHRTGGPGLCEQTGNDGWMLRAGESIELRAETAAEAAHRPAL